MEASSALSTPVRKPVLPVKIEARVGEQTESRPKLHDFVHSQAVANMAVGKLALFVHAYMLHMSNII